MNIQLIAPALVNATVKIPLSKSISNRALMISALCDVEPHVDCPALCDDTAVMINALQSDGGYVNVGAAGTAMRFLTAYFATRVGMSVTLDGVQRMRQRPIGPLVDALRSLGARIDYLGDEGFPPLRITGTAMHGGHVVMSAGVSSQFVSAVMMILPAIGGGSISLVGDIVSAPYIHMTVAMMRDQGAQVNVKGSEIAVSGRYIGADIHVEADWSAAAPWYALAALLPGSTIQLEGLERDSIQGDARLVELARALGIATRLDHRGATIDTSSFMGCCCSSFADMTATPDLVPSWVVLLCLLERSFRMTGVRTLRHKESDRVQALREELIKLGYVLKIESDDAISWYGERCAVGPEPLVIDPHDDHRLAMAFAPAAVRHPGLIIADADVVNKSYPAYWRHLAQAGFTVNELAQ